MPDRDYRLILVCTADGRHDWRELAVLAPVRPRTDMQQMGVDLPEPEGEHAAALARGWGVAGSLREFAPGPGGERQEQIRHGQRKSEVPLGIGPNGGLWLRLVCPQCPAPYWFPAEYLFEQGDRLAAGTESGDPRRVVLDVSTPLL